jgi:hypothetical protein
MADTVVEANVVDFDVARLEGRDHSKLVEVVRLLKELRLADGVPIRLKFPDGVWMLLFGKLDEGSNG